MQGDSERDVCQGEGLSAEPGLAALFCSEKGTWRIRGIATHTRQLLPFICVEGKCE